MKFEDVNKVVTPKTKAILMVHTYGLAAEAIKIESFCKENNIYLIEDSAEAHGQTIDGRPCGSFGDISTFSFYANKHITTGEGGMVLTNNESFKESLNQMRNLDFKNENRFKHDNLFWNYRLGGLQAALGISQIKNLQKTIEFKINQGKFYNLLFSEFDEIIQTPLAKDKNIINHYWVYGLRIKNGSNRDDLQEYLSQNGIQSRPFFWPLHLQKSLPSKFRTKSSFNISEDLGRNGFYIPMGKHVSKKDQKKIVSKIIEFLNK